MLRLVLGRAGTGKTAGIMREINEAVKRRQGGRMLIVPEQYSHEAERELCRVCGDTLSLYAEVFSFTGLARRIASQVGGGAAPYLDKGGRLLCMALALNAVGSRLRMYSSALRNAELQAMLLSAVDELKTAGVTAEELLAAGENCGDSLGDKLSDLALILEAYEAVVANGHADPADTLTVLASRIDDSPISPDTHIYIDGFIDFTHQEQEVMRALLRKGAELTVCLTVDELNGESEIYELSRRSARWLLSAAKELGIGTETVTYEEVRGKEEALCFFADHMFSYSALRFEGNSTAVELWRADSVAAECEFAAHKAISLVRDKGLRWRDIAIAVRGFEDYRASLESIFSHYGVPLFVTRKTELLSKPLPALIAGAYEILEGGWDVDAVVSYLRTGLTGLTLDECDELENYIFKWQLRAGAWMRPQAWHQHPEGYGMAYDEQTEARLARINELRERIAGPLRLLQRSGRLADTAAGQASALAEYFDALALPEQLTARSERLRSEGREALAQEYLQLWDIIVSALEQSASILGDTEMDMGAFGSLFTRMLSKYDVGTIPVALDRVSAGDFDRMRRRSIKQLIVLGASDSRIPRADDGAGMFTTEERDRLLEMDIDLGGGESELWREFSLIYNCLTLPEEGLCLCCPLSDSEGAVRPAFVFNRAQALFGVPVKHADMGDVRSSSAAPALELAASGMRSGSPAGVAAAEYFQREQPERFAAVTEAGKAGRGKLSRSSVDALYGKRIRLSASRVDKFAACKFGYFCQYGLKAKAYKPAGFTPPEIGTFTHYVLEGTVREVKALGGFGKVDDKKLKELTDQYVEEYIHRELGDFREKSERFEYLFRRIIRDVHKIVQDMAQELRRSDFVPLDFELDFGSAEVTRPIVLGEGDSAVTLTGVADRVDGWLHDGKLYLRVVDYKTGKKKFSMADIWRGMNMQLLLYLFALEEHGRERYGHEIVPAGVMYVPARSDILSFDSDVDDAAAEEKRSESLRRSGIVLDDEALQKAWENADPRMYIPVRFRYGKPTSDSLASAERLGLLSEHIRRTLKDMARQLHEGSISADPYYRSQAENACRNCDYYDACHFADGENGESCRYFGSVSADELWAIMEGGGENE